MTKPLDHDTQRMTPLDPEKVEPPQVRRFQYDTDPNAPPTSDLELLRGVNRAHDRIEAQQEDLAGLVKTPVPTMTSDAGPTPTPPSPSTMNGALGAPWRVVPLPRDKRGLTYIVCGFLACGIIATVIIVVVAATRPKKSVTTPVTSVTTATAASTTPPAPPIAQSAAPISTVAPLPTATATTPRTTTTATHTATASTPTPTPTTTAPPPPEFDLLKPK